MIRVLALDVDGVLTDDRVTMDEAGCESKTLSYRDIDGVFLARRNGLKVALVTGENSAWVDMIANRLKVDNVSRGAKDKRKALKALSAQLGIPLSKIAFVGNSARDARAFSLVGFSLAPSDASQTALAAAHHVLASRGGQGPVAEAVDLILRDRRGPSGRRRA